jgi:hypothetical protein
MAFAPRFSGPGPAFDLGSFLNRKCPDVELHGLGDISSVAIVREGQSDTAALHPEVHNVELHDRRYLWGSLRLRAELGSRKKDDRKYKPTSFVTKSFLAPRPIFPSVVAHRSSVCVMT